MYDLIKKDIKQLYNPEKAKFLSRFFKTGKGEYGEGDVFYGLTVPQSRKIAGTYKALPFSDVKKLLQSKVHEERLIALLILVHNFKRGDEKQQKEIYDFYLANTRAINNWDLVDLSADKIVGEYLWQQCHAKVISAPRGSSTAYHSPKKILKQIQDDQIRVLIDLAKSDHVWKRRIAIIATFAFIKQREPEPTFEIADMLLHDKHDLIHKAVGWMLREVGKRVSQEKEELFLKTRYKTMPRTMLRYAIERFPEEKRKRYLTYKI